MGYLVKLIVISNQFVGLEAKANIRLSYVDQPSDASTVEKV